MITCHLCNKLQQHDKLFVHEFEHAVWYLADNPYYYGYSILVSKQHIREWHEVPELIAENMNNNLRIMGKIIATTCQPHKLNLISLGNVVEHLHWHVVPRYLSDPNHLQAPDLSGASLPVQAVPKEQFEFLMQSFQQLIKA